MKCPVELARDLSARGGWKRRHSAIFALYSDRASHFFETPQAGGPVDQERLTQVGRALKELGIQMIPTYSLQTRGRAERRLAPGKDGCHKSCAWRGSPGWKKPTGFCASVTFRRSS